MKINMKPVPRLIDECKAEGLCGVVESMYDHIAMDSGGISSRLQATRTSISRSNNSFIKAQPPSPLLRASNI